MTGEESGVIGFECSERCIEHFPTRHDDDVEAANVLSPPEELTGRRFARLRSTAEPSFRVAATPNRGVAVPLGMTNTVMSGRES
jgi:hypothetical protein